MSLQRVFITGRGAVSSTGNNISEMWSALLNGKSGIEEIKNSDLSQWQYRLGGEVKDYQPAKMLPDRKLLKVISRQDVLGINAAIQAIEDSELIAYRDSLADPTAFNEDTAVYAASPGNKYFQQYDFLPLIAKSKANMQAFGEQLFSEVHPMWLLRILPNNVLAYAGITYGFKGENHNIVNHACSGLQAILEAFHAIQRGLASRAVVVAYDIGTEPQALFYYERLGVLSAQHLKPFDSAHDGTILAEGAAALVLESEASVLARQKQPLAEVIGGFAETEGGNLFTIDASAKPLKNLVSRTLTHYQVQPNDLKFIVAHGNGNPISDNTEALTYSEIFNKHVPPVTAYKWSMGHTLCAAGVMDTALAVESLQQKIVPGIANLTEKSLASAILNIASEARPSEQGKHVLLVNRGFAGMNATLMLKNCSEDVC